MSTRFFVSGITLVFVATLAIGGIPAGIGTLAIAAAILLAARLAVVSAELFDDILAPYALQGETILAWFFWNPWSQSLFFNVTLTFTCHGVAIILPGWLCESQIGLSALAASALVAWRGIDQLRCEYCARQQVLRSCVQSLTKGINS